jgi:hypothetical protein
VAALCDIFDCGPADLITVTATESRRTRRTSDGTTAANVVAINELRPLRARVTRDE